MSFEDGEWESKGIYLTKEGENQFIGIHSTGMTDEDGNWRSIEAWINTYDMNKKFVASVARCFAPIEDAAEDFKKEGWTVVNNWEGT